MVKSLRLAKHKQEMEESELEMIQDPVIESLENIRAENSNAASIGSRFPNSALLTSLNANMTNVTQAVSSNLFGLVRNTQILTPKMARKSTRKRT